MQLPLAPKCLLGIPCPFKQHSCRKSRRSVIIRCCLSSSAPLRVPGPCERAGTGRSRRHRRSRCESRRVNECVPGRDGTRCCIHLPQRSQLICDSRCTDSVCGWGLKTSRVMRVRHGKNRGCSCRLSYLVVVVFGVCCKLKLRIRTFMC